jgi:aldehyde:ferredoxin oxidoreductase
MEGNWNRIIFINLSDGDISVESLPEESWRKYVGGMGIGLYLYTKFGKISDPFSPENPLIITAGPLTGTPFPNSGRHEVVSRSPLTELFGEANSGGFFGNDLKKSGYDGMVIHGAADTPSIIFIDENIRIEKRPDLWGKDFYALRSELRREKKFSVMGLGRAGENRVLFSSIMNDEGRAAGRTGLGAVMGSKNLKAIAVKGNLQVPLADRKKFFDLTKKVSTYLISSPLTQGLNSNGSMIWMDMGQGMGDIPSNYFHDHNFDYDSLSSMKFHSVYKVTSYHCANCVIGCGRTVVKGSRSIDGPEYETVASFGPLLGNNNFDLILEWNDIINDKGMDTISTGVLISALNYFVKTGRISDKSISGYFDSTFSGIKNLIEDIAESRGIGNELKEGLERFALSRGIPRDEIATVKKMEIPMHDPRAFKLQGLGYATSTRGADHLQAEMYEVDMGVDHREIGIVSGDRWQVNTDERIMTLINSQNYRQIYNSAIICSYAKVNPEDVVEALNLSTGFDYTIDELMNIGALLLDEKRALNIRLGMKDTDDYLPSLVRKKIEGEPEESEIKDEEMESLLKRYNELRRSVS